MPRGTSSAPKYIPIERVRAIPTRDGDHAVVDDDPWRHSHRRETSRSSTLRKPEVADDLVDRGVGSVFLGVDRKVWLERHCRREVPSVEHLAERLRVRQLAVLAARPERYALRQRLPCGGELHE